VTLTATSNANNAFIGWTGDITASTNSLSLVLTSNVALSANFVTNATDIIIDNPDPGATFSGAWQIGTSSPDKYGADYRFASALSGGLSNAVYRPYFYNPGYYDVFLWYPQGSNRATNAPWTIVYSGGSITVPVDETVNGGGWQLLASGRPFAQGTNGFVSLSNDTGFSGKVVLADAVRFVYTGPLVVTPPRFEDIGLLGDGTIRLQVTAEPGHYSVEASTNLADWIELTNFINSSNSFDYIDVETNLTQRFYRARRVP
jgi:hypothetical protein